ncbi:agamous-like MADS-box protein AGL80 [Prunus avium]|uniref:Agamous-like MADS-box protein AGL80 n=1 Tax=Prunus avium TaxID=42229 RepID=A0A6P5TVS6_PRUAV|nr:agamous-like MADS-box protein AGL80 [Prunus avium]
MNNNKLKTAWIEDDKSRKACYRKRKICLLKKLNELTILCDVSAFVIIYCPEKDELVVWPSRPVVQELLEKFLRLPLADQCRKMLDQKAYLKERAAKFQEQIKKAKKKNHEMKMKDILHKIQEGKPLSEFETSDLIDFVLFLEEKMLEIQERVELLERHVPQGAGDKEKGKEIENNAANIARNENIFGGICSSNNMGRNEKSGFRLMGVDIKVGHLLHEGNNGGTQN